jgi:WD40 repeat protein
VLAWKWGECVSAGTRPPPDSGEWDVRVLTPTGHPLAALAAALSDGGPLSDALRLEDELAGDSRCLLAYLVRAAMSGGGQGRQLALIVDQFEELFTLCPHEEERTAFIENLMSAVTLEPGAPGGAIALVIALRADFYGHCARYPNLRRMLETRQQYIGTMDELELRRCIEGPLSVAGWQVAPGLVDLMIGDAGREPGALPLLSHALLETWRRRSGRLLTLEGYLASGRVQGAIAYTAETIFAQFDAEEQVVARRIFLRLTAIGDVTQETRRRVALAELPRDPETMPLIESVLGTLAAARLVTMGDGQVEVAHEALIREWPRLRSWLAEDRDGLLLHRRLAEATTAWEASAHDTIDLYRGARLSQAREWASRHKDEPNSLETAFLDASEEEAGRDAREREERRQRELEAAQQLAQTAKERAEEQGAANRKLQRLALLLAGALALALMMTALAMVMWRQARALALAAQTQETLAFSRELASAAVANLGSDPQLSLLLALESVDKARDAGLTIPEEAEAALHQAVQAHARRALVRSEAGVAVSPDGALAATVGADGAIRIWPLAAWSATGESSGMPIRVIPGSPGVRTLAFSPAHTTLIASNELGQVTLFYIESGVARNLPPSHSSLVESFRFSSDGNWLAGLDSERTAAVWEIGTGTVWLEAGKRDAKVNGLDLSQDGRQLALLREAGAIEVWDTAARARIATIAPPHAGALRVRFCGPGKLLVQTPETLELWDAQTGEQSAEIPIDEPFLESALACNAEGSLLATASILGPLRVWEVPSGRAAATRADGARIAALEFSPSSALLFAKGFDHTAWVVDTAAGGEVAAIPAAGGSVGALLNADGTALTMTTGRGRAVEVWSLPHYSGSVELAPTAPRRERYAEQDEAVAALAQSSDGRFLAAGTQTGEVLFWLTEGQASGEVYRENARLLPRGATDKVAPVVNLAISPDGSLVAAARPTVGVDEPRLRYWKLPVESRPYSPVERYWSAVEMPAHAIAFSPTSAAIAVGQKEGLIQILDVVTGAELARMESGQGVVTGISFSPDGAKVAAAFRGPVAKAWAVATLDDGWTARELFELRGHTADLTAIAFARDAGRLFTGSADGTVRVWDGSTGHELFTLASGKAAVTALTLSADGRRLAAASDAVRVYELPRDELLALARARVARDLTPEERLTYLREGGREGAEAAASQAPSTPTEREDTVRAFVSYWNRGDVVALRGLFTDDLTYSLDITGFSDYPIRADSLKCFAAFHSIGTGGRFKLVDCSPPGVEEIYCRLTYDNRLVAFTSYPFEIDATFLFSGDKIREALSTLPPEVQTRASEEGWTVLRWTATNVPAFFDRYMSIVRITTRDPATRSEAEGVAAGRMITLMSEIYAQRTPK